MVGNHQNKKIRRCHTTKRLLCLNLLTMSKIANSSSASGGAVYSASGTRLYGLDAELELKNQQKRDRDWYVIITSLMFR
jgi:hypothetical protein